MGGDRPDPRFQGQTVVIAGGFRGMGRELARLLLRWNARVFVVGRSPEGMDDVRAALSRDDPGAGLEAFAADLSTPEGREATRTEVERWCGGRLHHLTVFLGSGKTPFGHTFPVEHWQQVFSVNFFQPVAVVQDLLPLMMHGEGHPSVTLTAAIAGVERVRAPMSYSVAKTALVAYGNHLADALVGKGVRVNCVSPGNVFFEGGRWEELLEERHDEIMDFLDRSVGMKRLGTAEELAWVYASLMSPRNSFMTGQNVKVDGLQIHQFL